MDLGIEGRAALVAASSRGLGRATAEALAAEGVAVMLTGRDAGVLADTRDALRAGGGRVESTVVDVTAPGAPAELVAATVAAFGRADIVVANAGGPPPGHALEVDDAALDAALTANLTTSVRLARAALPGMQERRFGRIVCITSYTVVQVAPALALSNTARAGLWAWVKSAAHDLGAGGIGPDGSGITVNLLCPGPHATDRMRELGGGTDMGDPSDFGAVAAFLCSEQARFVNGAALVVDGGATLAL